MLRTALTDSDFRRLVYIGTSPSKYIQRGTSPNISRTWLARKRLAWEHPCFETYSHHSHTCRVLRVSICHARKFAHRPRTFCLRQREFCVQMCRKFETKPSYNLCLTVYSITGPLLAEAAQNFSISAAISAATSPAPEQTS